MTHEVDVSGVDTDGILVGNRVTHNDVNTIVALDKIGDFAKQIVYRNDQQKFAKPFTDLCCIAAKVIDLSRLSRILSNMK